jgi:hypothetical protein
MNFGAGLNHLYNEMNRYFNFRNSFCSHPLPFKSNYYYSKSNFLLLRIFRLALNYPTPTFLALNFCFSFTFIILNIFTYYLTNLINHLKLSCFLRALTFYLYCEFSYHNLDKELNHNLCNKELKFLPHILHTLIMNSSFLKLNCFFQKENN